MPGASPDVRWIVRAPVSIRYIAPDSVSTRNWASGLSGSEFTPQTAAPARRGRQADPGHAWRVPVPPPYARRLSRLLSIGRAPGKQVPDDVADNPLIFLTVTAPSFGHVHGTRPNGGPCRPRRRDDRTRCPHGRPTWCNARHDPGTEQVGQPLCSDCYDYDAHVIWQWWAPELWRRLTIEVRRALAARLGVAESRLKHHASIQYAKVAEYQARGMIHFHALIRLDGPAEHGVGSPAPAHLNARDLADRKSVV